MTKRYYMIDADALNLEDRELIMFIRLYSYTHQSDNNYMHRVNDLKIVLKRGEIAKSLSQLEKLWSLSREKVRGILKRWKDAGIIKTRVDGKGKNSITVISMFNMDEVNNNHNKSHNIHPNNQTNSQYQKHNKPQHNKELNNKELKTNKLNPEIFEFGLIIGNNFKGSLLTEDFVVPPIRLCDLKQIQRKELIDIFTARISKQKATKIVFLYSYIRELNKIYLSESNANIWKMSYEDYDNIDNILSLHSDDLLSALSEVTIIFEDFPNLEVPPKFASTSYFAKISERLN